MPNIQHKTKARLIQIKLPPIKTLPPPPQQQTKQIKQLRSVGHEFGIGYIFSHFDAQQTQRLPINSNVNLTPSTQAFAHGIELLLNTNYYFRGGNGGLTTGSGIEYLRMQWQEPLQSFGYSLPKIKTDDMISMYASLGGFYDVLRMQDKALRIFASVGVEINLIKDGVYDGYEGGTAPLQWGLSMPIVAGFRYIFANNQHGIEIALKYNPATTNYRLKKDGYHHNGSSIIINPTLVATNVHRDFSLGVRYVYEYR